MSENASVTEFRFATSIVVHTINKANTVLHIVVVLFRADPRSMMPTCYQTP